MCNVDCNGNFIPIVEHCIIIVLFIACNSSVGASHSSDGQAFEKVSIIYDRD